MNKANKAGFSNTDQSTWRQTDPLDVTEQPCSILAVDSGWLLTMLKWEQGLTRLENCMQYVHWT